MKSNLSIITLMAAMAVCGNAFGQTYSYTGAPVSIVPDANCPGLGANSNAAINVTGTGTINNAANVFINTKLYISCSAAFRLVLVAPNGDSCILLNMPYRTGACMGNCAEADSNNTLSFNSTFTNSFPDGSADGTPAPTGNYAPTASIYHPEIGNLNTFLAGKSINGNWRLAASGDAGSPASIASWAIVFGSTALPLDLLGFSGQAYAGYNELQWATASERNTASFDIQRSADGVDYLTIGKVRAYGSGSNNYRFQDNASSGVNLYRLRMIDNSGEYTYSKTVKISGKTAMEAGIKFAPNPVKDVFNITVTNKALLNTEGKIINSLGQIIYTFKIDQDNIQHNIAHLPAGIYFIRLNEGNHFRFVKEN